MSHPHTPHFPDNTSSNPHNPYSGVFPNPSYIFDYHQQKPNNMHAPAPPPSNTYQVALPASHFIHSAQSVGTHNALVYSVPMGNGMNVQQHPPSPSPPPIQNNVTHQGVVMRGANYNLMTRAQNSISKVDKTFQTTNKEYKNKMINCLPIPLTIKTNTTESNTTELHKSKSKKDDKIKNKGLSGSDKSVKNKILSETPLLLKEADENKLPFALPLVAEEISKFDLAAVSAVPFAFSFELNNNESYLQALAAEVQYRKRASPLSSAKKTKKQKVSSQSDTHKLSAKNSRSPKKQKESMQLDTPKSPKLSAKKCLLSTPIAGPKEISYGAAPDLPEGWSLKIMERSSGTKKGVRDRYWFSPTGKKFRSGAEISRFQNTLAVTNGDEEEAYRIFKQKRFKK